MILVDTSVWIEHLHRRDRHLVDLLDAGLVSTHPMVVGELALGSLRQRIVVMELLRQLPGVVTAQHEEVMHLVEASGLHGRGLSLVDAHLLASVLLTADCRLWTRDKRLHHVAGELAVAR